MIKLIESKITDIKVETEPRIEKEEPTSPIEALKASVPTLETKKDGSTG